MYIKCIYMMFEKCGWVLGHFLHDEPFKVVVGRTNRVHWVGHVKQSLIHENLYSISYTVCLL